MKHYITGILILATQFAHGAADDTPLTIEKLIGIAYSSRGKLSCVTSVTPNPKPSCSITLAYSEHAALKEKDVLDSITQGLSEMDMDDNYDRWVNFPTRCRDETAKYITPALPHQQSPSDNTFVSNNNFNLIALCIKLGLESYTYSEYSQWITEGSSSTGSHPLYKRQNKKLCMHVVANHCGSLPLEEIVPNAQLKAEDLQKQNPKSPFHLVIKLDAWRSYIDPIREQIEDEDKNRMVLKSDKNESCSVQ
jgi:hypothetical protein